MFHALLNVVSAETISSCYIHSFCHTMELSTCYSEKDNVCFILYLGKILEWGVLPHCLGFMCISKVVYEKSKADTRAFEAYKATHSARAASLLPVLKNTLK